MPKTIKKGTKIYISEGPHQEQTGIVTQLLRAFDKDDKIIRWTVWAEDLDGGDRIKTRLAWCREL